MIEVWVPRDILDHIRKLADRHKERRMLIDCRCGVTNRLPRTVTKRTRCGKCAYEFTPADLVKARVEPPPTPPDDIDLDDDDLDDYDEG